MSKRVASYMLGSLLALTACAGKPPGPRPTTPSRSLGPVTIPDHLPTGALARMGRPRLAHSDKVMDVDFSPDGRLLAAGGWHDVARIWDVRSGLPVFELGHPAGVDLVSFSPNGKTLLTVGETTYDRTVCLWDSASGKRLHLWEITAEDAKNDTLTGTSK